MKEFNFDPEDNCSKCGYSLDKVACQTFYYSPDLETSFLKDIKMSLFMKEALLHKKDCPREEDIFNDTDFYSQGKWFSNILWPCHPTLPMLKELNTLPGS